MLRAVGKSGLTAAMVQKKHGNHVQSQVAVAVPMVVVLCVASSLDQCHQDPREWYWFWLAAGVSTISAASRLGCCCAGDSSKLK
jgi:hypothetical protein